MVKFYRYIDYGGYYGGLQKPKTMEFHDYHEVQNLDIPGVDNFTEFHGVYFTFQENTRSLVPGDGRWILTTSITNPASACTAYYYDAFWRIDQALEDFKNQVNNLH